MYIELVLVLIVIFFCLFTKKIDNIFYLIVFILPFHAFIKNCFSFFLGSGQIFSFWKEIAILILLLRIALYSKIKISGKILFLISCFFSYLIVVFLLTRDKGIGLPTLRSHVFPIFLFFSTCWYNFDTRSLKKLIILFSYGVIITNILGFVQLFVLKVPIALLMNNIDVITSEGYIVYNVSSFRIMGFERMAGVTGSPNILGFYNAFAIVFLFGILNNYRRIDLNIKERRLITTASLLSVISIILTFSRAGWVIAFIGIIIMLLFGTIRIRMKDIIKLTISAFVLSSLILIVVPHSFNIISNSLKGKEASMEYRDESVMMGFDKISEEPLGHGLGTTDNNYDNEFFVESAMINIIYEIGVIGVFLMFAVFFLVLLLSLKSYRFNLLSQISIALTIPSLLAFIASVNPFSFPFIFYWWFLMGLGLNKELSSIFKAQYNVCKLKQ